MDETYKPLHIPVKITKAKFYEWFKNTTIKAFNIQKMLNTNYALLLADNTVLLGLIDTSSIESKELFSLLIKKLIKSLGVQAYCFATEAWMKIEMNDEDRLLAEAVNGQISMLSDRKEGLFISFEEKGSNAITNTVYDILRDDNKNPILQFNKEYNDENSSKSGGRFANLFEE